MANLLYLVHRLPYPPNKGDKVRSYHLLKHLVARHQVFLGTFVDDSDELVVFTVVIFLVFLLWKEMLFERLWGPKGTGYQIVLDATDHCQ